jgi:hypothetical protein
LNAEPQKTGVSSIASTALRIAALSWSTGTSPSSRYFSASSSSKCVTASMRVLAAASGRVEHVGRDVHDLLLLAEVVEVADGLHADEVDDAGEVALGADRQLDRDGVRAEALVHRLHGHLEVRAHAVHLVDERDARDGVLVGLAPDGLGLRLDAGDRVEQRDRAVEDAQRALDLDGEVDVAGVSMMLIRWSRQ